MTELADEYKDLGLTIQYGINPHNNHHAIQLVLTGIPDRNGCTQIGGFLMEALFNKGVITNELYHKYLASGGTSITPN